MVAWDLGVMLLVVDNVTCESTHFNYFNPVSGSIKNDVIPALNGTVNLVSKGQGNDLWVTLSYTNELYYYSSQHNTWNSVSMSQFVA